MFQPRCPWYHISSSLSWPTCCHTHSCCSRQVCSRYMPGYCLSDCYIYLSRLSAWGARVHQLCCLHDWCLFQGWRASIRWRQQHWHCREANFLYSSSRSMGLKCLFQQGKDQWEQSSSTSGISIYCAKQYDSIDLLRAGLGLHSFYPQSNPSNRDAVDEATTTTTTTTTTEPDLWVKVDADLQGQKPKDYCLEVLNQISSEWSKGYFVCFQITVDGAAKQHDVVKLEGQSKNQPKRLYLQTWWEASVHLSIEQQHKQAPVSSSVGKQGNWEAHWLPFLACSCLVN